MFGPECTVANRYAVMKQLQDDMEDLYDNSRFLNTGANDPQKTADYKQILEEAKSKMEQFKKSDLYLNWISNKSEAEVNELKF